MNPSRPRLTDILAASGGNGNLADTWNKAVPAGGFIPIPAGDYIARIIAGELETARTRGTPGYKLTFEVIEGPGGSTEHTGRRLWHDLWLTPAAIPMTKRDVAKLGITTLEQLEQPIPQGIRCRVRVALRTEDNDRTFNRVTRFDVIGIDPPPVNPFAPDTAPDAPPTSLDELPTKPNDEIPI